ncbi:MAG: hypothetical protein P8Z33_03970 [Gammaproteobacteria bacterium]
MERLIRGLAFLFFAVGGLVLFVKHAPHGIWSALSGSLTFFLFFSWWLIAMLASEKSGRAASHIVPYSAGRPLLPDKTWFT